jgi:hypothetical protein
VDKDINYFKPMNPATRPGTHQRNFVNGTLLARRILRGLPRFFGGRDCASMFYMYLLDSTKYIAVA